MWIFWVLAAALGAGAALAMTLRAAQAAQRAEAPGEDPAQALYRRQLDELDELSGRGLLGPEERRAAEAEASRRLLSAADRPGRAWSRGGRASRRAVAGAGALAAVIAVGLYLDLGRPGLPDQPYRLRLAGWRAADPTGLTPGQMAAVLRALTAERPRDPRAFEYLGRAELASGDPAAAARAFAGAARLAPAVAPLWAELGEALAADAEGKVTPGARAAFARALALDPANPPARYYLARAKIAGGDVAGGLAGWRALAAGMAPSDPRRPALLAEIDHLARPGTEAAPALAPGPAGAPETAAGRAIAAASPAEQAAFIRGMVSGLAARLKASPDDPQGWARLVRAYAVLGDAQGKAAALADARRALAGKPDGLAQVETAGR